MCGRIALVTTPGRLVRLFDAVLGEGIGADEPGSYNIPPSRCVLGVAALPDYRQGPPGAVAGRVLSRYRWGLVPPWARDPSIGSRMFNARRETVATKPAFRSAFACRRLVVPADGFYEWQATGGRRRPFFFQRADGRPMALAGLWERWSCGPDVGPDGDGHQHPIVSCTIITTAAGPDMAGVHDRSPVVLGEDQIDAWLDPAIDDREQLSALLEGAPPGTLAHHAVDRQVGNVRNDTKELIEPVGEPVEDPGGASTGVIGRALSPGRPEPPFASDGPCGSPPGSCG